MLGIYLSGTGNTKHCVEKLVFALDENGKVLAIEDEHTLEELQKHDVIILGYPTQFSNMPFMIHEFIKEHQALWSGKKIFCLTTMGLFSGDGTGCSARYLRKYGAQILGGAQIKMPDSVCDNKLLKKPTNKQKKTKLLADQKIDRMSAMIKKGKYPQEGLRMYHHLLGLFGQRLWFHKKTASYSHDLCVHDTCTGCGHCVKICPMHNITLANKAIPGKACTMCYRCLNQCPQKAITLLGKEVHQQYQFDSKA